MCVCSCVRVCVGVSVRSMFATTGNVAVSFSCKQISIDIMTVSLTSQVFGDSFTLSRFPKQCLY